MTLNRIHENVDLLCKDERKKVSRVAGLKFNYDSRKLLFTEIQIIIVCTQISFTCVGAIPENNDGIMFKSTFERSFSRFRMLWHIERETRRDVDFWGQSDTNPIWRKFMQFSLSHSIDSSSLFTTSCESENTSNEVSTTMKLCVFVPINPITQLQFHLTMDDHVNLLTFDTRQDHILTCNNKSWKIASQ